jgi:hypothetical protein
MGRRGPHPGAVARTTPEAKRGRAQWERFAARFPGVTILLTRVLFGLPPFRLRDALVRRVLADAFAAFSRRDWEINTLWLDRQEYVFVAADASRVAPGMKRTYQRPDGYIEAMETYLEPWSAMAAEVTGWSVTGRGRFAVHLLFRGEGAGSGMPIEQPALTLVELRRGLVVKQTYWWDAPAGRRALGLQPPQARR